MATRDFGSGIQIEFDDVALSATSASDANANRSRRSASRRGGGRFETGPRPLQPTAGAPTGADRARDIADRLKNNKVVTRTSTTIVIGAGAAAASSRRGDARSPSQPTKLTVRVEDGEEAVVLIEGDGVLAWRFGQEASTSVLDATQRRGKAKATRVLEFDLGVPPIAAPSATTATAKRGFLKDRLIQGVKAIVLYFAATAASDGIVKLLERNKRDGPVILDKPGAATDVGKWRQAATFTDVNLPQDRPPRILLLVHGTFSSSVGGFGELTVTPWGQRLLTAAQQRYDAVLAFDHRTLALDPRENAEALGTALATLKAKSRREAASARKRIGHAARQPSREGRRQGRSACPYQRSTGENRLIIWASVRSATTASYVPTRTTLIFRSAASQPPASRSPDTRAPIQTWLL